jgi:phosphate-selective porin OprO/OprP
MSTRSMVSSIMRRRAFACAWLFILPALPAALWAQSPESDLAAGSEGLAKQSSHFNLLDFHDEDLGSVNYEDEKDRFSVKFGLALLAADYTSFEQDEESKQQVGNQQDEFEARSLRLIVRGHFELLRRWNYKLSYEYKGFDKDYGEGDWAASDFNFSTELGPRAGKLTIGKMKESHAYELVGDAANLPHHERYLSPFFRSRNVGLQLTNAVFDERATWAVGWYNDWWLENEDFGDSGNDFAARFTVLPVWRGDGDRYLHLGASVRYYGADEGMLRYRGRPATNLGPDYVDTGNIPGDHAWHGGLELLWTHYGFSVLGEYIGAELRTRDGSNPYLDGYYVTVGWVLSGEHRPYDRQAGYARRVLPQHPWGAVELIGRYGVVDTDDGIAEGGTMEGWWAGVNWWATNRWKFSVGYGDIDLDRFGITGSTRTLLSRLQWIY